MAGMVNSSCWREGENINHLPVSKSSQREAAVLVQEIRQSSDDHSDELEWTP